MHTPHNRYNVEWTKSLRKPQRPLQLLIAVLSDWHHVSFQANAWSSPQSQLVAVLPAWCRMNIQHMRHTTTICHEKKPHTIEILIMQHLYFRFQGNLKFNDLNKHATVPMCNAHKIAPHANNVISTGSQSNRPLWCRQYEFLNEVLKGVLWRCNSWTICVHGYWKTKQSYFDQKYIFIAMQMTKAEAISNCAL